MYCRRTLWLLALLTQCAAAQTVVSGVVNTYHRVIQTAATGWVRVDATTGLAAGDLVLIIQMKGATISTANNSSFGSVTNLNGAGNYELNSICAVRSDTVFLFRQLAQTYTATDRVQLVKVPQYTSAVVTAPLLASPWDNNTGKGGVVAIKTGGKLTLNAAITATGTGYRGGASVSSSGTCYNFLPASDFSYDATATNPQDGAYKGESIVALPANLSGGKGAAANGGGGGNNHNNGGGGGSNIAAGGLGGGNSSLGGCRVSNPGQGGYPLSNSGGTKLFMGGGGGAGHLNSGTLSTGGGAGGGIVFLIADELVSNGNFIRADGTAGGAAVGDGASGGGAGGTVVLAINQYLDAVQVSAAGGNGGTEDDVFTNGRCYGEGGGGSGGALYFKTAVPAGTTQVAGGRKGDRLNSTGCAALVAGTDGATGTVTPNYQFIESATLAAPCGALLDAEIVNFKAQPSKQDVLLEWTTAGADQISAIVLDRKQENGSWTTIAKFSPASAKHIDRQLSTGNYSYRLRLRLLNSREMISKVQMVSVGLVQPVVVPNPAKNVVTINYPFVPHTTVRVMDIAGRVVHRQTVSTATHLIRLDVAALPAGIYVLRIDNHTARFIRE